MDPLVFLALFVIWLPKLVSGQIPYNPLKNSFVCIDGGNYCGGKSLQTSILMSCASRNVLKVYSCDVQLSRIVPPGYESWALCYESSPDAGNAVCAFNGTAYDLDGATFSLPQSLLRVLENNPSYYLDAVETIYVSILVPAVDTDDSPLKKTVSEPVKLTLTDTHTHTHTPGPMTPASVSLPDTAMSRCPMEQDHSCPMVMMTACGPIPAINATTNLTFSSASIVTASMHPANHSTTGTGSGSGTGSGTGTGSGSGTGSGTGSGPGPGPGSGSISILIFQTPDSTVHASSSPSSSLSSHKYQSTTTITIAMTPAAAAAASTTVTAKTTTAPTTSKNSAAPAPVAAYLRRPYTMYLARKPRTEMAKKMMAMFWLVVSGVVLAVEIRRGWERARNGAVLRIYLVQGE